MKTIYDRLGVGTVINASGTLTRMGGTIMLPEVIQAMNAAAQAFVRMEDLQEAAGRVIADVTGAEAGYVTNGASGGLMLAAAACIAGFDPAKMDQLPDTTGMPNEVIIQRGHRTSYDHAIRAAGARIVEVGYTGFPGKGGTHAWQIESAINQNTVAIAHPITDAPGSVPLPVVAEVAHRHSVPVIVDAAAELPPVENLWRFVAEGADLVVFSGGKALRGPQASGILAGRRDLIESAALQHQDLDVFPETWTWRRRYLDSGLMSGPPHQGIGRACKIGKEEIVGLITALQLYVQRDHEKDRILWLERVNDLADALKGIPHLRLRVRGLSESPVPQLEIWLDEESLGLTALDVVNFLLETSPMVALGQSLAHEGGLLINPFSLEDGEEPIVVERVKDALLGR